MLLSMNTSGDKGMNTETIRRELPGMAALLLTLVVLFLA